MIINQNSTLNTLKKYLLSYRGIFYKRSFEIFTLIILSFITMQKINSIKFIYEKFISKHWNKSLNSFYYFLSQKNFCIEDLMKITIKNTLSIIPKEQRGNFAVYLSIDDTLQPKFGDKFEHRYKFFDHAKHSGNQYINGHCIVTLTISIPIIHGASVKHITLPIGSKIYDKSYTKIELAKHLITSVMPQLDEFQVIVLCDSWYTKSNLLELATEFENLDIIGAVRSDTVLYDLKPAPTGKRGRPREKGVRLDYKNFDFEKDGDFYIAKIKCITNLFKNPVYVVVTVKDIEKFSSVRLYLSTIDFNSIKVNDSEKEDEKTASIYDTYKIRWNIEVVFYQEKLFWSFGNYMVRGKISIEKYINLVGVAYSMVILLPFLCDTYSEIKFQSPQEIKHIVGEEIREELFFSNLLEIQQIKKNLTNLPFLKKYQGAKKIAS